MKKLMTMIAAVATAFGLYAADEGFLSGAGFDTTGETAGRYSYTYNSEGGTFSNLWTVTEGLTWTSGATRDSNVPTEFSKTENDGYMAIKTTLGSPVFQKVNDEGVKKVGEGLYFDSLVKFTAFDETPQDYYGKLAVYLKTNEEETETSLYVRAAGADGSTNDYAVATTTPVAADTWYRLTIKAIKDIGNGKVAFMVFVDGDAVAGDFKITSGLKPQYAPWGADGKLFLSLGGTDDEIEGVGFDGQGAIDDIVFTTVAPEFAEDPEMMTVTWPASVEMVSFNQEDWMTVSPTNIELISSGTIYWKGNGTTCDGFKAFTGLASGGTLDISDDVKAAIALVGTEKFGDLNKAVAAAADKTLTLLADATNLAISASMTLDLNRYEVKTNAPNQQAISVSAMGVTLTIDDQSTDKDGKITGAIFIMPTAYGVIKNGIFDGSVMLGGSGVGSITDGKFLATANTKQALDAYAPDGYEFIEKEGYFELAEKAKTFAVTAAAAAANTKLTVQTNGVDLTGVNNVYTANIGDTIVVTYKADEGYQFADGAKTTDEFTTDDDTTFATAPVATIKTYTVTYIVDGQQHSTEQVNWGATPVNVPTPAAKTGYTGAWDEDPADAVIKADKTFTYTYTPVNYTITYWNGENVISGLEPTTYTVEAAASLPAEVGALLGGDFKGWYDNPGFTGNAVTQIPAGSTGNTNFYAKVVQVVEQDPTVENPEDVPANQTAGSRYGDKVPEALAYVSAKSICTWAKGNGQLVKGVKILEDAFLLNCANSQTKIDEAKANFKATSITVNSDGSVTVGTPAAANYNGTIKTLGKAELSDAEWSEDTAGKKFFELKLVPTNLN